MEQILNFVAFEVHFQSGSHEPWLQTLFRTFPDRFPLLGFSFHKFPLE